MMRSLFAGASGLRNHQLRMDVIGDNIANVNTLGFKSSRVQFSSVLAQSISGASAPTDTRGGINAMQIGLGSAMGSVTTNFSQGSLQSTGTITDLSIEGDSMFVLGDGDRRLYSRAGQFRFDANGLLTDPVTGYAVMGFNADEAGDIITTGELGRVRLPFSQSAQARASTTLTLGGNLNADSSSLGTIVDTRALTDDVTEDPATVSTILSNLKNSDGTNTGLVNTDKITITARVGGTDITPATFDVETTSQLSHLLAAVESALGLTSGTVTMDADGSLRVTGDPGLDKEISNLSIRATDVSGTVSRTVFDAAMSLTDIQSARDEEVYSLSKSVFDSLGFEHTVTLAFTRQATDGRWTWAASVEGQATVATGGTGTVSFGQDGTLESFGYDGSAVGLVIEPHNGANTLTLDLDPGQFGSLEGMTQFASPSNAGITTQDGFGLGALDTISIDQAGTIVGIFTNGVTRNLAQIGVAQFANPAGLGRAEGNSFVSSANSGVPLIGVMGARIPGRIQPGTLEMSNVDLALEFTNMVITQRGFQANARIITTSDDMLTELVNLKR